MTVQRLYRSINNATRESKKKMTLTNSWVRRKIKVKEERIRKERSLILFVKSISNNKRRKMISSQSLSRKGKVAKVAKVAASVLERIRAREQAKKKDEHDHTLIEDLINKNCN